MTAPGRDAAVGDDNLVTTFCELVTPADKVANLRRRRFATKEMGEAMAPASESPSRGGYRSGAGAAPVTGLCAAALLLGLLAGACSDDAPTIMAPASAASADRAVADPARNAVSQLDGAAPVFGDAVLAELTGDLAAARAGFEHMLAAADTPAPLAARAALHLAQLESRAGRSRRALDLLARASALAPGDAAIADGAADLQADVAAAAGTADVRGPRIGTPLPGVPLAVAAAFAAAERALDRVHRLRPRPVIEALSSSLRAKEDATEDAVAKYRAVAARGGLAEIAATYRIGSLYHDLALGLPFELPPELDPAGAAGLRRTLRGRVVVYLKKAVAAYRAALAVAKQPDDELWRLAAESDLRGASDVLGEAGAN